jgi:hypothetical protein
MHVENRHPNFNQQLRLILDFMGIPVLLITLIYSDLG